jgi:hypothetical protein
MKPKSPQQREAIRIAAHRAKNWPNEEPIPQSKAQYLPPLRKGGGQQELRT